MRFKDFLLKETQTFDISPFVQNLRLLIKNKAVIYRAETIEPTFSDDRCELGIVERRTTPRRSKSGSQLLLNMSTRWKGVPRRDFSYFASMNSLHADGMFSGKARIIVPADNIKKFAFSGEDFNYDDKYEDKKSISYSVSELDELFYEIRSFLNVRANTDKQLYTALRNKAEDLGIYDDLIADKSSRLSEYPPNSIPAIFALCDFAIKAAAKADNSGYITNICAYNSKELQSRGYMTYAEVLDDFTPENFGVTLLDSLADLPKHVDGDEDELWFEGAYLTISPADANATELVNHQAIELMEYVLEQFT